MRLGVRISAILLVPVLAACGGRAGAPPRPDMTLVPEIINRAATYERLPCDVLEVTLESGRVLTVELGLNTELPCTREKTAYLIGDFTDITSQADGDRWTVGRGPLVFAGTADGEPWVGTVELLEGAGRCFRFAKGQGAYLEGDELHFSTRAGRAARRGLRAPELPPGRLPAALRRPAVRERARRGDERADLDSVTDSGIAGRDQVGVVLGPPWGGSNVKVSA